MPLESPLSIHPSAWTDCFLTRHTYHPCPSTPVLGYSTTFRLSLPLSLNLVCSSGPGPPQPQQPPLPRNLPKWPSAIAAPTAVKSRDRRHTFYLLRSLTRSADRIWKALYKLTYVICCLEATCLHMYANTHTSTNTPNLPHILSISTDRYSDSPRKHLWPKGNSPCFSCALS